MLPTLQELNPIALHPDPAARYPARPDGTLVSGRLNGPAVFPLMLYAAREAVKTGLPVIVDGGVFEQSQAEALLDMGVLAMGLGTALWGIKFNM